MVLQAWTNMAATIDDEARVVEDVDDDVSNRRIALA